MYFKIPRNHCRLITLLDYLICIRTSQSQVNNNMPSRSVNLVIECIDYLITGIKSTNRKVEIAGHYTIIKFNFRHFQIFQLEKLALFNLAYFCHPPIKPKFPSRQNYPIYGISKVNKGNMCSLNILIGFGNLAIDHFCVACEA